MRYNISFLLINQLFKGIAKLSNYKNDDLLEFCYRYKYCLNMPIQNNVKRQIAYH